MSAPGNVRRKDRQMADEHISKLLAEGRTGRLATIGPDGYPYCVPLLYVWQSGEIWLHNTSAHGHLRRNIDHSSRVCFEIDEAGPVFDYGRFECDSSVAYRSVIAFGRIRIVDDRSEKQAFCDALMAKYGTGAGDRPKSFYPRLDQITVYAMTIDTISGKELALPAVDQQWPAQDNTRTPNAKPE